MKFEIIKHIAVLLVIVTFFGACQREDMVFEDTKVIIDPSEGLVDGRIMGQITDENGLPIANVEVGFRDYTTYSDADGQFLIEGEGVFEHATSVSFVQADYFDNYKTFNAQVAETTFLDVILIRKEPGIEFDPFVGQRYEVDNAYIDLPTGIYTDKMGNQLASNAIVQGHWISPDAENVTKVPGNMNGVNTEGELVNIANYGVFLLELMGDADNSISLPKNKNAEISFPVSDQLKAIAPQTISMWYFDTANKIWVEEGTATLDNGSYKGQVSHLSYWTCGTSHDDIELNGHINTAIDIQDLVATIFIENIGFRSSLNLAENGNFSISIPAGQAFVVEVSSMNCGAVLKRFVEGPYNVDVSSSYTLGHAAGNKTISGTVVSCDGTPVSNGFIRYAHHNTNYFLRLDQNGAFSFDIETCDDFQVELMAINSSGGEISELTSKNLSDFSDEFLMTCTDFIVTEDMDYLNLDWDDSLKKIVKHEWKISKVTGSVNRIIISPTITNSDSGELVMTGNFVFNAGDTEARYELNYLMDGFSISGTCELFHNDHLGEFDSYQFVDVTTDIVIEDDNLFPGNVGEISFNLTYFD